MVGETRRGILSATLIGAMTATSFQIFALAVLAPEIIAEFDLTRGELGLIGSVNTLVGGLTAPFSGRITDWMGPRRAVIAAIVVSAVGMALMAMAPGALVLALSAVLLGVPQGWGNPATNALIAERVADGSKGVITGVKQSGVQFGVFLSGLTLPSLALWMGWRGAMWGFAGLFAVLALAVWIGLRPSPAIASGQTGLTGEAGTSGGGAGPEPDEDDDAAQRWILRLAVYALCAGTVGGAVSRFFPLWAQETVGLSSRTAGLLVALGGFLGMGARVMAGRVAERQIAPPRLLSVLALIGAVYCVSLGITLSVGDWILWPATLLNAVGIGAWNAVAMLAVIVAVPAHRAGRASGIVMMGFLVGLSLGSPVAGYVVDRFGTYQPIWWVGAALMVVASTLTSPRRSGRLA